MKVGIMQPYFFPYLGYWQLINAVDQFVLLDDVNFIMRGYINRNSILLNGDAHKFTIPLEKPSQNKLICESKLNFSPKDRNSFLKTIQMAYKKAPYFQEVYALLEDIILLNQNDLTKFLQYSLEKTRDYLGLKTTILLSSQLEKTPSLKAQDRIIDINKRLGASLYINAIGGQALYDKASFHQEGIDLKFIQMLPLTYPQYNNEFVPNLSMIDVLMFNSKEQIHALMEQYELIG